MAIEHGIETMVFLDYFPSVTLLPYLLSRVEILLPSPLAEKCQKIKSLRLMTFSGYFNAGKTE